LSWLLKEGENMLHQHEINSLIRGLVYKYNNFKKKRLLKNEKCLILIKHMVNTLEQHMCNSNNSFFVTPAEKAGEHFFASTIFGEG
jgi:hemerythrin-like domain-containing protein